MNIKEAFNQKNCIKNLCAYELYYQVSLGKLSSLSKINDLDYEVDFTLALGSIYEVIQDIKDLKNAKEILDNEIQKQAAMDAMQNFVNANLELIKNKSIKVDDLINEINDEKFFNETMNEVCEINYQEVSNKYKKLITEELSIQIIKSLNDLIK